MTHLLNDSPWLRDMLAREFKSDVPPAHQGQIFGIVEEGQVRATILAEHLIRVGQLWICPEDRKTVNGLRNARNLIRDMIVTIPEGMSAIAIDDTGDYGGLLQKIGLRPVEGKIYRIDF